MGFSLGGVAAACVAAAAACIGGGDAGAPAADLGASQAVSTTFATFSSPPADVGVEAAAPKAPLPPSI